MPWIPFFDTLVLWLRRRLMPGQQPPSPGPGLPGEPAPHTTPPAGPVRKIAWGAHVSAAFRNKVIGIADRLEMDPSHLMAIMAFETGRSFDPSITNHAGSGATGLIQFMPATARRLGTTTSRLALMTDVEQLDYVERYLAPYAGRMDDLASAYMAVLYPRAVGQPDSHVLFRKGSRAYKLNSGLDADRNGLVTKAEAAARVQVLLTEGLRVGSTG